MYSTSPNIPNGSEAVSTKVPAEAGIDVESTRVIIVIEISSGAHTNVFKMVFILLGFLSCFGDWLFRFVVVVGVFIVRLRRIHGISRASDKARHQGNGVLCRSLT